MEKLSAGASNLLTGDTHILIDLSSWYKSSLSPKIELIHDAILSSRKVSFTYFAPKGESMRTIKAKVQPEYKWRLIEEYGADSFTVQPDGTLLFSFGFMDKTSIISWISSFGDGAELLEPKEFRKGILAFAEGIRKIYL